MNHKLNDRPEDDIIKKLTTLRPLRVLVDWISEECISDMKVMMGEVEQRRDFKLLIAGSLLHP